jgi:hypothetical protein
MGWQYDNLSNEELQRIAIARFGCVLRPLKEIGREAVIRELKAHDRLSEHHDTRQPQHISRGRQ